MSNNVSTSVSSNNITALFAGFLGAFIVGSLGVQLVRTQKPSFQSQPLKVQPVIAHQSTLWAALGEQDTPIVKNKVSNAKTTEVVSVIAPVVVLYEPAVTRLIVTSPPSLLSVFDAAFFKAFARLILDKQQQFHLQE